MKNLKQKQKGFTLLETLVAIFILMLALNSLFSLTTNNFFAAKYAKNESTSIYLTQEAIDYIRNDRDSIAFQGVHDWNTFLSHYGDYNTGTGCYSIDGCTIDATDWNFGSSVEECMQVPPDFGVVPCKTFFLNDSSLTGSYYTYTYQPTNQSTTKMKRQIKMVYNGSELFITVNLEWLNGEVPRTTSLNASLLQWQ